MKALAKFQISILLLLVIGVASALAVVARDPQQRELESRAARVFQLEAQARGKLPAHEVRALSLALTFHDHRGAEKILTKLERSL